MKSNTLAVCVVRLQVPELHAGHRYLLNTVFENGYIQYWNYLQHIRERAAL